MNELKGLGIGGYRSFPTEPMTYFSPLSKVNLIAGQNNSGKSNLLRFIHGVLATGEGLRDTQVTGDWDRPLGTPEHRFRFAIGYSRSEVLSRAKATQPTLSEHGLKQLDSLLDNPALHQPESELIWWEYTSNSLTHISAGWTTDPDFRLAVISVHDSSHETATAFARQLLGNWGGNRGDDLLRVMEMMIPPTALLPVARTIVALRQILHNDDDSHTLSGTGLIRNLRSMQNPALQDRADRAKFEAITRFVRAVLDDDSVVIDIPHDLSAILVTRGTSTLPLENLGTGVHEVVIIAAAATMIESSIVCVEEPEIHLHPLLQRKLLAYLALETTNQYFIATHSAHMLDSDRGSIFHLRSGESGTAVTYAGLPKDRAALCADLGYRPSHLVQANSVIWVEGPSDRIYIRHWIQLIDPGLIEGTHYSIMFYGGRLLNHLSSLDPEVGDFISLRRMNRFMVVVIDSDKTSAQKHINDTKKRVQTEFADSGPGFAWITKGYTIENYVPNTLLNLALSTQTKKAMPPTAAGQYENPLAESRLGWKADKVKLAHEVVGRWEATEWSVDLKNAVEKIVQLVRTANGL